MHHAAAYLSTFGRYTLSAVTVAEVIWGLEKRQSVHRSLEEVFWEGRWGGGWRDQAVMRGRGDGRMLEWFRMNGDPEFFAEGYGEEK